MEVNDDVFVDGYVYDDGGYPDFDIVEVFIDEDLSGGLHVFDNNAEWGQNSENAFSYHLAADAPADGETQSSFVACDIDGENWPATIMNYADHFPEFILKKSGNTYLYEFSMKVYDDTYDHGDPEASRVSLELDKELGLSLAYCDNDTPGTERDNFFGSVWVEEAAYNDHWKLADDYGRLRLVKAAGANQAVEVTGSIADFEITQLATDLEVHPDLGTVFNDPDGDPLEYEVSCDQIELTFTINGSSLLVHASAVFEGQADVSVTASDGLTEVTADFQISCNITGIEKRVSGQGLECYPNPFSSMLNLKLDLSPGMNDDMALEIYSMSGACLKSQKIHGFYGEQGVISLDLGGLPEGSYVLKLQAGHDRFTRVISKK